MRWFNVVSFFESLRPVYLTAKIFLLLFETVDFERRTFRRTLSDQIRYVLTLIMDLYLTLVGIRSSAAFLKLSDSILLNVGYYGSFLLTFILALVLPTWHGLKARNICALLESVACFDDEIKLLGFRINHQKHHFISTIVVNCSMFIAYFMIGITTYAYCNENWLNLTNIFPEYWMVLPFVRTSIVEGLFICYFCLMLLSLRHRFAVLNRVIMKFLQTTPEKDFQILFDTETCCRMIRKFATLHDQLCDAIKLFNCCFSTQAMFVLATAFGFTIFSIFGLIHAYATTVDDNIHHLAWSTMFYDGFYISFIIQLVVFSGLIHVECKRTALLIHKVICYGSYDRKVRKELRIFSQQLCHHSPKVSCNLFDFDWTLFYTIAGSLSTYLIILMQFDLINFDYAELTDKKKSTRQ
ncbi:putative gustatory receptor 28b [Topomyia yanbarensis]|uniref:putative gustatory receptor 28b n=1 Tax=Topomyia yanbarensis TaxID=2498891 RepID=UPI00273AF245|nr:putative gustatory receptor 28b [Topomyia yanbarensis]